MNLFSKKSNIILYAGIGAALIALIAVSVVLLINGGQASQTGGSSIVSATASTDPSSSTPSSSETESSEPEEIKLSVTSPSAKDVTVNTPSFTVRGSGDPTAEITLNGERLETDENGIFSKQITLKEGENKLVFSHKGEETSFTVRYKKLIIKSISPSSAQKVNSEEDLTISCTALKDSKVTATFNGSTVTLYAADNEEDTGEYTTFVGSIKMPISTSVDKNYGKITFKAQSSNGTATKQSGNITVKKYDSDQYDGGNGYPKGSRYLNVGTTYIAEVIAEQGETYSVGDATDLSRPTNNYLPKGTVDYCSPYIKEYQDSGKTVKLATLRYGNRMNLLAFRQNVDIKIYEGTLPETNKLNIASYEDVGRHMMLTLDVDWKAPFRFEMGPQSYNSTSASNRDYSFSTATYNHIDIIFCYGEELTNLPEITNDPLFSSFEIIKGEYDITLRLHLKERGVFYGWSAEYNEQGQLQFKFLKAVELKTANNEYGYSLDGVKIVIDAGHGGRDNGAGGFNSKYPEDVLNLKLAKELEKQLLALGATVIMTRVDDSYIEIADRFSAVRDNDPDLVISIHRNASSSSSANSFASYHFNPYTKPIADELLKASLQSGVYNNNAWSKVKWHVFFLSRVTDCPSVLTENGFMTNKNDYANMLDDTATKKSATALTKGIMNYFIAQQ